MVNQANLPIAISGADVRLRVAMENHRQGNLDRAEALYTIALRSDPDFADALNLLARVKLTREAFDQGLALIGRALELAPRVADYHLTAGVLVGRVGRTEDALAHFDVARVLAPNSPQADLQTGALYENLGDWPKALAGYEQAVECDPHYGDAHNNRGTVLRRLGRIDEAEAAFRRVLAIDADHVAALANLSLLLTDFGDLAEAEVRARQATAIDAGNVNAWTNLGTALYAQGRTQDAVEPFRQAIALDENCIEAHANLGMTLLALGEFAQGWPEYEWRWKREDMRRHYRDFGVPQWTGEPLQGRTVLIHAEQGAGDTLQGLRYVALIKASGGRVVLDVQAPLVAFLQGWPGVDGIIRQGDTLPPVDFHAPAMSLPHLFATTVTSIPPNPTHLVPSDELVARWGQRLPQRAGMRVGLCWQGNPAFVWDRWRSIALSEFSSVLQVPACSFVSVHKGTGEGQIADLGLSGVLHNPSAEIASFADTAAIMMNLDLVITSCTSVAHLAGVLGRPVWVVLNAAPDWRWLRDRDDTPWYPSMTLFRQERLGHWGGVMDRVTKRLADRAQKLPPG